MSKLSTSVFRNRIENHLEKVDLDVVCRKRRTGFALYWDDDDQPLAKLRPTGRDDEVEVYSWEDNRWREVAELEATLPLEEALEYIIDDPDEVFFDHTNQGDPAARTSLEIDAIRRLVGLFLFCSAVGGAVGGVFFSPIAGAAWGALAGILCAGVPELCRGRIKPSMQSMFTVGILATIPTAVSGALGASLHGALGTGIGWLFCSALIGFLCGFFLLTHRLLAWAGGFAASLAMGMQLVGAFDLTSDTARFALVAFLASIGANVCFALSKWFAHYLLLARVIDDAG